MFVVYAIYNSKHKKIYLGQTADLQKRMNEHNNHSLGGYTSSYDGKWEVIYTENYETRIEALKREKQLKSYRGREYVKRNIPE